jgi:hypothetical protein
VRLKNSEYPFPENPHFLDSPNRGSKLGNIGFLPMTRLHLPKTATIPSSFYGQIPQQYSPESKQRTCVSARRCRTALYPEKHPLHDKFEGPKRAPFAKLQVP